MISIFLVLRFFPFLIILDPLAKSNRFLPKPYNSFLYLSSKVNLNLFNIVGPYRQGNLNVLIQKLKILIPVDPDQPVYLVWKASEETFSQTISVRPPQGLRALIILLLTR